jgi:hypothetical protein
MDTSRTLLTQDTLSQVSQGVDIPTRTDKSGNLPNLIRPGYLRSDALSVLPK